MSTRQEFVTLRLREMILRQEFGPGSRVPERDLAVALGVSRTPVRVALGVLASEGLVSGRPNCGYVVEEFSIADILAALDIRGLLEGHATRSAVDRGFGSDNLANLAECIAEGNDLVLTGFCGHDEMGRWIACNDRFHQALVAAADEKMLGKVHAFVSRMPYAAPAAILFTTDQHDDAYSRMCEAHRDHVVIATAIRRGESARAEMLVREHAYHTRESLELLLKGQPTVITKPLMGNLQVIAA